MTNMCGHRVFCEQNVSIDKGGEGRIVIVTNLGLNKCLTAKIAPRSTHSPPTTIYAIPKNGFFPPMTVVVEITIDLVPPYCLALKSAIAACK